MTTSTTPVKSTLVFTEEYDPNSYLYTTWGDEEYNNNPMYEAYDDTYDPNFIDPNTGFHMNEPEPSQVDEIELKKDADGFLNPYSIRKYNMIRLGHFRDARVYDAEGKYENPENPSELLPLEGFTITHRSAKKKYGKWLQGVRKIENWEGFRRGPKAVTFYVKDAEHGIRQVTKVLRYPYTLPEYAYDPAEDAKYHKNNTTNSGDNGETNSQSADAVFNRSLKGNSKTVLPQSKVKGAKIDDEDFKAKMFTKRMGQLISSLRTSLGISQADLAKTCNVDASIIKNIERGNLVNFNSNDPMVKTMAKALGIPTIKYQE